MCVFLVSHFSHYAQDLDFIKPAIFCLKICSKGFDLHPSIHGMVRKSCLALIVNGFQSNKPITHLIHKSAFKDSTYTQVRMTLKKIVVPRLSYYSLMGAILSFF